MRRCAPVRRSAPPVRQRTAGCECVSAPVRLYRGALTRTHRARTGHPESGVNHGALINENNPRKDEQ